MDYDWFVSTVLAEIVKGVDLFNIGEHPVKAGYPLSVEIEYKACKFTVPLVYLRDIKC